MKTETPQTPIVPTAPRARDPRSPARPPAVESAVITLAYYDAEGRIVDSEQLHVPPDAGSVWIKPSTTILSWPAVRSVRASLVRTPVTPVDMEVHLLPPACDHTAELTPGVPARF